MLLPLSVPTFLASSRVFDTGVREYSYHLTDGLGLNGRSPQAGYAGTSPMQMLREVVKQEGSWRYQLGMKAQWECPATQSTVT